MKRKIRRINYYKEEKLGKMRKWEGSGKIERAMFFWEFEIQKKKKT